MRGVLGLLSRLKVPFLLVVIAGGLYVAVEFGLIVERWREMALITAQFFLIIAVGWSVTTLVDGAIKRRVEKFDVSNADSLSARKIATRLDVLRRIWIIFGAIATLGAALTVVPWARQIGVSLFASAGIAGIAVGIAARPVLSNLIAGLQIAFTQPIRLDDVVIVEGEWGRIEEIGLFYVVVRIWDLRRLIVPLSHFTEQPFENWSHKSTKLIGSVFWFVDYTAPIEAMREKLDEFCEEDPLWDGDVKGLVVTESDRETLQVRAIVSARNSSDVWTLRCNLREKMVRWLQAEHPGSLPRRRTDAALREVPDALDGGLVQNVRAN